MNIHQKISETESIIRRFPNTIEKIQKEIEHHKEVAKRLEELATEMMRANIKDLNEI